MYYLRPKRNIPMCSFYTISAIFFGTVSLLSYLFAACVVCTYAGDDENERKRQ